MQAFDPGPFSSAPLKCPLPNIIAKSGIRKHEYAAGRARGVSDRSFLPSLNFSYDPRTRIAYAVLCNGVRDSVAANPLCQGNEKGTMPPSLDKTLES